MHEESVRSGEVSLAVQQRRKDGAPTVVLVHGFPDTHAVWDQVAEQLWVNHDMAVVSYDVRGAGRSTAPSSQDGYRTERLVDDLVAVMDHVAPDARVHLVGHDWGSVQLWDAVTAEEEDPRLQGRIGSFTSMSGPSLDHLAHAARRLRADGDYAALLRQGLRSWYVSAFQLPVLPELFLRGTAPLIRRQAGGHFGASLGRDAAHGVNLYRANIPRRMKRPGPGRTRLPVQVLIAARDPFIDPAIFDDLASYAPRSTTVTVDGGHWVMRRKPEEVASLVAEHVRAHDAPGPEVA